MPERRHEPDDANVRGILLVAAGLAIAILTIHVVLGAWLLMRPPLIDATVSLRARPPSSPSPLDDMPAIRRELQAAQRARLDSVGWVDRAQEIAHIPIEDAMQRMIESGFPEFRQDAGGHDQ